MPVKIFFCYAHEDEALLDKLKAHLMPLQRQGLLDVWHDRDISAGEEWEQEIKDQLNAAQIILLLVSPDFMASDYCYGIEMQRALERHERRESRVIPIILRSVDWEGVLRKLQALPTDAKPIKSWSDSDEAFYNVTKGIRKVVEELMLPLPASVSEAPLPLPKSEQITFVQDTLQQELQRPVSPTQPEAFTLLLTLGGHADGVTTVAVAIGPDGQTLASGSVDNTIKLWNLKTGQLLRTLEGHESVVTSVAISPDGQILVSGSTDGKIKLWGMK